MWALDVTAHWFLSDRGGTGVSSLPEGETGLGSDAWREKKKVCKDVLMIEDIRSPANLQTEDVKNKNILLTSLF